MPALSAAGHGGLQKSVAPRVIGPAVMLTVICRSGGVTLVTVKLETLPAMVTEVPADWSVLTSRPWTMEYWMSE